MLYEEMDRIYQMIGEFRLKEFDHEMDPADYWGKLEIQLGKFVQDKGGMVELVGFLGLDVFVVVTFCKKTKQINNI